MNREYRRIRIDELSAFEADGWIAVETARGIPASDHCGGTVIGILVYRDLEEGPER